MTQGQLKSVVCFFIAPKPTWICPFLSLNARPSICYKRTCYNQENEGRRKEIPLKRLIYCGTINRSVLLRRKAKQSGVGGSIPPVNPSISNKKSDFDQLFSLVGNSREITYCMKVYRMQSACEGSITETSRFHIFRSLGLIVNIHNFFLQLQNKV